LDIFVFFLWFVFSFDQIVIAVIIARLLGLETLTMDGMKSPPKVGFMWVGSGLGFKFPFLCFGFFS